MDMYFFQVAHLALVKLWLNVPSPVALPLRSLREMKIN